MLYERWLLELWHGEYALEFKLELGPIAEGDLVAARWTGVGRTEEGDMPLLGNDILRVQEGRFAEYWVASWAGTP